MSTFLALLRKDLVLELRSKMNITLFIVLGLLLSVVAAFAIRSAGVTQDVITRTFPGVMWLIFIFVGTLFMGKAYQSEFEEDALTAVYITGISDALIYTAKVIAYSILVFACQVIATGLLALFLNVSLIGVCGELLVVIGLVVFGYVAIAQLFSVISSRSVLTGLLLPIILVPVLLPLFFAAVELSSSILLFGAFPLGSTWLTVLIALDAIYFALGINLYKHALLPS